MRNVRHGRSWWSLWMISSLLVITSPARGGDLTPIGAPGYQAGVGGYVGADPVYVDHGIAAGSVWLRDAAGQSIGVRGLYWQDDGQWRELGPLSNDATGTARVYVKALGPAGLAVGESYAYDASGQPLGTRAVYWDASGTPHELAHIDTSPSGVTYGQAVAINRHGVIVGNVRTYDGSIIANGDRAVRWDTPTSAPVELEIIDTYPWGPPGSTAYDINDAGAVVGTVVRIVAGSRTNIAARWTPIGQIEVLGNLGVDASGRFNSRATLINNQRVAAGFADKYDPSGVLIGTRAVRWSASSPVATELGGLGPAPDNVTATEPVAINDAGVIVGQAKKYDALGNYLGDRAVRWDPTGTQAIELDLLPGQNPSDPYHSFVNDINNAGFSIGEVALIDEFGNSHGYHPVLWDATGQLINLDDMLDLDSYNHWRLGKPTDISDDGWISGVGIYFPNGMGTTGYYLRSWMLYVPQAAVPEPASLALLGLGLLLLPRRRFVR